MGLPQEILDAFIDEIACTMRQQESLRTLTACALVNRSMNHRCRKHLFFSIETSRRKQVCFGSGKNPRLMSLRKIMENNPTLVQYIRHLRIDLGINGVEVSNLAQHLPHVLRHFSVNFHCYLETVVVFTKAFSQVKFLSLPILLQQSLFGLQHAKSLSALTLFNLTSVPVSFITGFPNLLHLCVTGVSLIKDELIFPTTKALYNASMAGGAFPNGGSQISSPTLKLYTLNVNRFLALSTAFLDLDAFSALRNLTANISGISDAREFVRVIGSAANSLETLDLNVASNRIAFPFSFALPLDAGLYPSLRAVTFRLQLASDCRWIADHDSVILKSPSHISNLRSVQLILTQYIDVLDDVASKIDDSAGWRSLDDALNSRNFVCLSVVDLVIAFLTHSTSDSFKETVKMRSEQCISKVLPRLSASVKVNKRVCIQVL